MSDTPASHVALPPVLLLDDSEDDMFLLRRAFRRANLENPIVAADSGHAGIALLDASIAAGASVPALVVTDLKMPNGDGFEVVRWIRTQAVFAAVPVVVISGSIQEVDLQRATALGSAGYLEKHPTPTALRTLVVSVAPRLRFS